MYAGINKQAAADLRLYRVMSYLPDNGGSCGRGRSNLQFGTRTFTAHEKQGGDNMGRGKITNDKNDKIINLR